MAQASQKLSIQFIIMASSSCQSLKGPGACERIRKEQINDEGGVQVTVCA